MQRRTVIWKTPEISADGLKMFACAVMLLQTQKRYEDKIKAKKKAEIEAKKAAIRAEDMEKGVFIPASSLPKKEPQKAPMPAKAAM